MTRLLQSPRPGRAGHTQRRARRRDVRQGLRHGHHRDAREARADAQPQQPPPALAAGGPERPHGGMPRRPVQAVRDRIPLLSAGAAAKEGFWSHARHPDVILLGIATVIVLVVLVAWLVVNVHTKRPSSPARPRASPTVYADRRARASDRIFHGGASMSGIRPGDHGGRRPVPLHPGVRKP